MLRPPFLGHRRFSITHRAVQRLRELVLIRDREHSELSDDEDDETLRDRLDAALGSASDEGKAIRTLDAMLGEPQTLIPIDAFGDVLYAIIKEDTVVTVLPKGHGEEILQRGQAMQQRVTAGQSVPPSAARGADREEAWDPRRRWRKDGSQPVVIERIVRGPASGGRPADPLRPRNGNGTAQPGYEGHPPPNGRAAFAEAPQAPHVDGPVAEALRDALENGRRRAAVIALAESLRDQPRNAALLPLWNQMAHEHVPETMTIGDLIEAVRLAAN